MKRKTPDGLMRTLVLGLCLLLGLGAAASAAGMAGHGHVPPPYQGVVTVAAAQTNPILFDNASNLADILAKTEAAANAGAELIVFPELALTGYKFKTIAEALPYAETIPGPAVAAVAAAARAHDIYVAFGLLERHGVDLFDSVALVGPEGYIGKYRKAHTGYRSESKLFSRGETDFPVFRTAIGRIALGICYDQTLPEGTRVAGVKGADILALSYADGGARWDDYLRSRAAENNAYAIGSNRIGEERFGSFIGGSVIAGPNWDTLAQADAVSDTIVYADIDLGVLDESWRDRRRPELYGPVAEPLARQVMGLDFNPESQVFGTGEDVIVRIVTASVRRNTPVVAELLSGDAALVRAWGRITSQGATIAMTTPDDLPVGSYTLRVRVARDPSLSIEQPYVVKDVLRPRAIGIVPNGTGASARSSIYLGFDVDVLPASGVPVIVSDGTTTRTFAGSVNTTSEIDNRFRASYSGLQAETTYTATLPADSIFSVASGAGNMEETFSFTTAAAPFTIDAAVVQMSPTFKANDDNLAAMLSSLDTVAATGAQLAVFPELAVTGSGFTSKNDALAYAEEIAGPSVTAMVARAQELGLHVAFGMLEKDRACGHGFGVDMWGRRVSSRGRGHGGHHARLYSTYVLAGPEGLVGTYRKTHLSEQDALYLDPGDGPLPTFDTAIGEIGLMLGDDVLYPEVARVHFLQGAAVIAMGANLDGTLWTEQARTRGGESKVWILAANTVAPGGGLSIITSSTRTVSVQAGADLPETIYATLDIDKMRDKVGRGSVDQNTGKVRATHYELDRRPDLYEVLVSRGHKR